MGRRVLLAAASAFVAVNIWTGAPLLALWVGSHLVSQTALSTRGVAIVLGVLTTAVFSLAGVLSWLNRAYVELVESDAAHYLFRKTAACLTRAHTSRNNRSYEYSALEYSKSRSMATKLVKLFQVVRVVVFAGGRFIIGAIIRLASERLLAHQRSQQAPAESGNHHAG